MGNDEPGTVEVTDERTLMEARMTNPHKAGRRP